MKTPHVLYEDKYLLVLDKPAGLVINRAQTTKEPTLQDWLEDKFEIRDSKFEIPADFVRRAGIVHRLDKETSGVLLVAKTAEAFADLQRQFKERKVEKRYLALVHGKVEPSEGIIKAPISRSPFDRKKFGIFLGGREAETRYKTISNFKCQMSNEEFTLLELEPKTGRTHQVRVHLKYIGHPVVGDEFYAGRKTARADRRWCPRQFLHAWKISFCHPKTGDLVEFCSPLPKDLEDVLKYLK
ncbi:MAG: RluA family pseudouridine synthase [Microgenomates group bacterium]